MVSAVKISALVALPDGAKDLLRELRARISNEKGMSGHVRGPVTTPVIVNTRATKGLHLMPLNGGSQRRFRRGESRRFTTTVGHRVMSTTVI